MRERPWRWLPRAPLTGFAVLSITLLSSAALSARPWQYALETALLLTIAVIGFLNTLLLMESLPEATAVRVAERVRRATGDDLSACVRAAAGAVLIIAAVLSIVVYQAHPHIPDEVAYLIQAKYLAAGRLWMASPPVPDAFSVDLFSMDATRWYSAFPPGWPALLAIGVALGVPWVVNPVLGAANVLLAFRCMKFIQDERTAALSAFLLAVSPWHLLMAMSFMSHTASLTVALLATYSTLRARADNGWRWGLSAGCFIGLASVNRPLEGVALAAFLSAVALGFPRGPWRLQLPFVMGVGALVSGATGLWYNRAMTGHLLRFPVEEYFKATYGPGRYEIGFGSTRGLGWPGLDPIPGHGVIDVGINTLLNLFQLNTELLGWSMGSLAVVVVALVWKPSRVDRAMLGAIGIVVGIHSLFWFSGGPDFGARYWFLLVAPLAALAARGLSRLGERGGPGRLGRCLTGAGALSVAALLIFVPWRAADKYHHYRGMSPEGPRRALREIGPGPALVLVQGSRFPDYASTAIYNPIDVRDSAGVIFAWDKDSVTRSALLEYFVGRPVWLLSGPTINGGAWRLRPFGDGDPTLPGANP